MAARYLYSRADNNPDLQKQIGCMTGIFQLLDPQHILTGRRICGHSTKRLPSGSSHFNSGTFEKESNNLCHCPASEEKISTKVVKEKQRICLESSRASFSSYSRSSFFSSPDSNGTAQPQHLSFDQSSSSSQFGRQSLDLSNEGKDSMYRKDWRLSVETTTKEETGESTVLKHENSPRPLRLSKSVNGSFSVKVQEASSRTSCGSKDQSLFSVQKDAPGFSYDGGDISRLSFESQDTSPKLKELPRLSLDSRQGSVSSPKFDSESDFLVRKSQRDGGKRPPSVVAKLMGLEILPDSALVSDSHFGFTKTCQVDEHCDPFPSSLNSTDPCLSIRTSTSFRNSGKESGLQTNPESVKKLISILPVESAPWKQLGGNSQKPDLKHLKTLGGATNSFPSDNTQIEKRLKDIELSQSGKDLIALKQIIEAIRAKGLLDNRRKKQDSSFAIQKGYEPRYRSQQFSSGLVNKQKPHSDHVNSSTTKGGNSLSSFESQIVIMKPAKLVKKSDILASSVTPVDSFSSLPKLHGEYGDRRKNTVSYRSSKKQIQNNGNAVSSSDNIKTSTRSLKFTSPSSPNLPKENTIKPVKRSGSVSPRLQQKKLELDKRYRPPITPDSSKSRRPPNNQLPGLGSPDGKSRPKCANLLRIDDQSSDIRSETWKLSYQQDGCCMRSDGNVVMDSVIDTDIPNLERCAESNGSQSPSIKNKFGQGLSEDGGLAEFASVSSEYSSPVSVLDETMYKDDAQSPVKWMPDVLKDDGTMNPNDNSSRRQLDSSENLVTYDMGYIRNSQINRKKLESIEHLVKKLRQLNSTHDEAQTDYIASLCETTNPDHRYICEILLASGFLLRDLNSTLTNFQLHPFGHPINPELFLVLEQTKSSTLQKEECNIKKLEKEKFHRKLIFDAVNEILEGKLASMAHSLEPWLRPEKLARKSLNAQKILRDLCSEMEQLQAKKSGCGLEENEDESLKSILWEALVHPAENWTDFRCEISRTVLDVEQQIFKDLVDEIVHGEPVVLQIKPGRCCRQLFA